MKRRRFLVCLLALASGALAGPAAAQDGVNRIRTDRDSTLLYHVTLPPGPVRGIAILFVGGAGRLDLARRPVPTSRNFLVRVRERFARRGFVVALPDAPSDRDGLVGWRASPEHVSDIAKLARHLRSRWPVPVWLVGTSRGAISAAAGGAGVPMVAGVVLTASVTQSGGRRPATVYDAKVALLNKPAMVVHHRDDACPVSPPNGAVKLFAKLTAATVREMRMMDGGHPGRGRACGPISPHGFLGVEAETVCEIVNWIGTFDK